jgi:hypothetical protein
MANEFKHKDPGAELTQAEFIAACGDGHIFACQATGDIAYASSATVLSKLAKGTANMVLHMGGSCIPAWTASPSVTDLTIGGGCITLTGAATDIDLIDNNASALSFDASGKAGIIDIVTTNCSEGVTMSGTLGVTGVLTATGGLAGGAICIGSSTITTTGLISGGSLDIDNVLINGTTIGHTCDTDLLTVGNATLLAKGTVTVGVDGTGHDVKLFGCAAGAFMEWDESANLLEIRGATAAGPGHLKLTTGEATVACGDVLGKIEFQAPAETGADALRISASIAAVAQVAFDATNNATDLIFYTGHSEDAAEKFRFTSQNEIGIAGANYGNDGQVLTSGGGGAAVAWEDAGGAVSAINNATANELVTIGATTTELCAEASLTFDGNQLFIGDTANANVTSGLTIKVGAAGGKHGFVLKSSVVNSGLTTAVIAADVEIDDFYNVSLADDNGGAVVYAIAENSANTVVLRTDVYGNTASTSKTNSGARGMFEITAQEHDGSNGLDDITANGNVFCIRAQVSDSLVARMMLDEDGELHLTNTTLVALSDDYDDNQLLRALYIEHADQGAKGFIRSEWDKFCKYNRQTLTDVGILPSPEADSMIAMRQLAFVTVGATGQNHRKLLTLAKILGDKHPELLDEFYEQGVLPSPIEIGENNNA